MEDLLSAAEKGIVKITYAHYKTGEEITKNLTLMVDWSIQQRSESRVLAFFDSDKKRFESIDTETIIKWEKLEK
jgi:hypothetical protein